MWSSLSEWKRMPAQTLGANSPIAWFRPLAFSIVDSLSADSASLEHGGQPK
jgi:hypothetical protein